MDNKLAPESKTESTEKLTEIAGNIGKSADGSVRCSRSAGAQHRKPEGIALAPWWSISRI